MGGKQRRKSFVYPAYELAHVHLLRLLRRLHRRRLNCVKPHPGNVVVVIVIEGAKEKEEDLPSSHL